MTGMVYFIGVGPGDPELLTVKGLRLLKEADVILYDRHVHPSLLSERKMGARIIYCDKFPSEHTMKQQIINRFLIKFALDGKRVARLQGGDPFVFGSGGEEAAECAKYAIPFEVVPGIPVGTGTAAYAGIPVTHRGVSKSFMFMEGGNRGAEETGEDLVHTADTICILTSASFVPVIIAQFLKHGRSPKTPVAFVHQGTMPDQCVYTGSLKTIAAILRKADVPESGLFIIGEAVQLHYELDWFQKEIAPY